MSPPRKKGRAKNRAPRKVPCCPVCRAHYDYRGRLAICYGSGRHRFDVVTGKRAGGGR